MRFRRLKQVFALLLSVCMIVGMASQFVQADTGEYDYPNKYLWYENPNEETFADYTSIYAHHSDWGTEDFDIDAFVNSKQGEEMITGLKNFILCDDEMDQEVVDYWESQGLKKELHDTDDDATKWASYVPLSAEEGNDEGKTYPVIFVFHGSGNTLFAAETYGFANVAAENDCIAVIPETCTADEVNRILEELKEDYPIDESRIYCTGFSAGGTNLQGIIQKSPEIFAAVASGGSSLSALSESDFNTISSTDIPVLSFGGTKDRNTGLLHYRDSAVSTAAKNKAVNKCLGLESWAAALGIADVTLTPEEALYIHENSDDPVKAAMGVDFQETEMRTINETDYYIGNFYNEDGLNSLRFVAIEGCPHWVGGVTTAQIAWEYMSQYARNPETGELIILDEDTTEYTEGVTVEADSDSSTGYAATFVYKDNSSTISKVEVYGAFQFCKEDEIGDFATTGNNNATVYSVYDYEEGMFPVGSGTIRYEMIQAEDGIYTVSLPLPATQYFYKYRITYTDGTRSEIQDPVNPCPDNNGRDAGWSLFYVGDSSDTFYGMEYIYPRTDGKTGSVTYAEYTAIDGTEQNIGIYLPYDYDSSKTYKTIYVSHGGGGNEVDWMTIGSLPNIMDNLLANNEIADTIVVTMDNIPWMADNYTSWIYAWNYDKIMENMNQCIIPYIEDNYSVSTEAEDRAFCGLSMGSITASVILQTESEDYGYYGCFSGAHNGIDTSEWDVSKMNEVNIYVSAGSLDSALMNGNYGNIASDNTTRSFSEHLTAAGIDYTFQIFNGTHDWYVWPASFADFAKNVLWDAETPEYTEGVTVEADSDSPTGYTATFVYKDSEAETVQLSGSIFGCAREEDGELVRYSPYEWEKGMVSKIGSYKEDMVKVDNDTWVLELPLPSGAYPYSYIVDGESTTDPANKPLTNTITATEAFFSMVYMPFDSTKQDLDLSVELPRDDQNGSVVFDTYYDAGEERELAVYLPYGYDENRSEPYKVIYLSHGSGGHELDWMNDGSVPNIMDNLVADGKTEPAVVVAMNNSYYYTDTAYANQMDNIMPYVEENYNVATDFDNIAYCGLSLGGSMAANIYLTDPTAFGYFGIWSSAQVASMAIEVDNLDMPTVMLGMGKQDSRLSSMNIFAERLTEHGVEYSYYILNGGHDWGFWPKMFTIFAEDVLWKTETLSEAELEELFNEYKDLFKGRYTDESWATFQDALASAKSTLGNNDATTQEIIIAYNTLKDAIDSLEKTPLTDIMETRTYTDENGMTIPYRIYLPENYDESKEYPLVTFLHGAGERGTDNIAQISSDNIAGRLIDEKDTYECIIIAPQCPKGQLWANVTWSEGNYILDDTPMSDALAAVQSLIISLQDEYSIDADRLYLTGLSSGGFGTWDLIMRNPNMFAAAVPICGGADPSKADLLTDMPIWTFHGSADPTVPVDGTRAMVAAIIEAGSTVIKYTEYEGVGHDSWTYAYAEEGLLSWMFSQSKEEKGSDAFRKYVQKAYDEVISRKGSDEYNNMTSEAKALFSEYLEKAAAILAKEDATNTELMEALNYIFAASDVMGLQIGDIETLSLLVEEIEGLDLSLYRTVGQEELANALTEAKAILAQNEPLEEEVSEAIQNLIAARLLLRLRANTAALQQALAEAQKLNLNDYTVESVNASNLISLMSTAAEMLEDPDVEEEDVEDMTAKLYSAMGSLVKLSSVSSDDGSTDSSSSSGSSDTSGSSTGSSSSTVNAGTSPKTGDNAIHILALIILSSLVSLVVIRKRRAK